MVDSIQHIVSQVEPASRSAAVRPSDSSGGGRGKKPLPPAPVVSGGTGDVPGVVRDINSFVSQVSATKVTFDVDDETGRHVVRVLNKETGDVIRQLPPEALLNLMAKMKKLTGLIFNEEV
ncbi:MAG: flagellar protein FlaG [Candidatus Marinimicrobia bacterium]|nr:flagellar protein FlaG [Candidatus Neomarinimicrobiota bacterium]